jgi:hypothetical protein
MKLNKRRCILGAPVLYFRDKINYIRIFRIYWPIWMAFGTRDLHVMLLGYCPFHENLRREGRAFHVG